MDSNMKMYLVKQKKDNTYVDFNVYLIKSQAQKAIDNLIMGINAFAFRFMPKLVSTANPEQNKYGVKNTIEPFLYGWNGEIETLYSGDPEYSCDVGGIFCTKIIQINGWKIPKDYPYKF